MIKSSSYLKSGAIPRGLFILSDLFFVKLYSLGRVLLHRYLLFQYMNITP